MAEPCCELLQEAQGVRGGFCFLFGWGMWLKGEERTGSGERPEEEEEEAAVQEASSVSVAAFSYSCGAADGLAGGFGRR